MRCQCQVVDNWQTGETFITRKCALCRAGVEAVKLLEEYFNTYSQPAIDAWDDTVHEFLITLKKELTKEGGER